MCNYTTAQRPTNDMSTSVQVAAWWRWCITWTNVDEGQVNNTRQCVLEFRGCFISWWISNGVDISPTVFCFMTPYIVTRLQCVKLYHKRVFRYTFRFSSQVCIGDFCLFMQLNILWPMCDVDVDVIIFPCPKICVDIFVVKTGLLGSTTPCQFPKRFLCIDT